MHVPPTLALAVVALASCAVAVEAGSEPRHPLLYWAKPIAGQIVDADTEQPLDGVIVVAQWVLTGGPRMHIVEVVSDRDGKYVVPGWGPKPRHLIAGPLGGYYDPQILCFKADYSPRFLTNEILDNFESVRTSIWDGKTVEMKRFNGAPEQRTRELSSLQGHLDWGSAYTRWQEYPRMALAVIDEAKKIPRDAIGRLPGGYLSDHRSFAGLTEEHLRVYVRGLGK